MHKYVVVTGGGSGLGRSLALRWARAGAHVCIADINEQGALDTVTAIEKFEGKAFSYLCDVTKTKAVQALKNELLTRWPQVDLVINNAGVASADQLEDEPIKQWQWIFDINLFAMVKVSQIFTSLFKQQGYGYFINVASQAGLTPIPYMASYSASKAAVVSLSETMRIELADYNIGVSVLCPGFFSTNLGSSLKTKLKVMHAMLAKMFEKSELSSDDIAACTYTAVEKAEFLIITHKMGLKAFRLKRWLPMHWYLKLVLKQTAYLRAKVIGQNIPKVN